MEQPQSPCPSPSRSPSQSPFREVDSPEAMVRSNPVAVDGEQTRQAFACSTSRTSRMSSLEMQKDEARQNLMRIIALEEKEVTFEEQIAQLNRKYWELVRSLSEQEGMLTEISQTNAASPKKCMDENLQHEMTGEQLKKENDASVDERGNVFNQQLEKLKQQVEEQGSQLTSSLSELEDQVEALRMQHKAFDLRLSPLCGDDPADSMHGNKDMNFNHTVVNLQNIVFDVSQASLPVGHNSTMAQQANLETSTFTGPDVHNADVGVKKRQSEGNKEGDASQHHLSGKYDPAFPQQKWII